MSKLTMQPTPARLRAQLQQLGRQLSEHHHALHEIRHSPADYPSKSAELEYHDSQIRSLEQQRAAAERVLQAIEAQDAVGIDALRERVLAVARLFGQATPQAVTALAHPLGSPDRDATSRRVAEAFRELVEAAERGEEGVVPSGETGLSLGRGRPPEFYTHVPAREPAPATNGHGAVRKGRGRK